MSAEDGESMISCLQEKSYSFRLLEEDKRQALDELMRGLGMKDEDIART